MYNLWLAQVLWCQRDQELRQEAQRWLRAQAAQTGETRPRPLRVRVQRWAHCKVSTWRIMLAARRGASPLIRHEHVLEKPC